jgi:hypothetical protein
MYEIITIVIAISALVVSIKALWDTRTGKQFDTIDKVLGEINQMGTEVYNLHKIYSEKKDKKLLRVGFTQLLSKLFNRLDWISLLINKHQIKDESLLQYLYPMIKDHYEGTFIPCATDHMRKESEFKQFKILYEKLRTNPNMMNSE